MYWDHPGWFMMMGLHSVLWIGLLVLLIIGIFLMIRGYLRDQKRSDTSASTTNGSAREILDSRYARGEIDRDEYMRQKKDLSE